MRAAKIAGIVILVLILGVAGLVIYAVSNLDSLVQTAVEKYGSDVTQTEVTLQNVETDLQAGRVQLSNFAVANPAGYSSDNAFALDDIIVQIAPGSVRDDVVVIEEISVAGASIIAELKGLRNSNLQELAANVRESLPDRAEPPEAEPPAEYTGPNFRVERFTFSDANISLLSEQFRDRTIDMPTVTAQDLGGEAGLPPKELAAALMNQVLAQAIAAVRSEVEDAAKREVRSELQEKAEEKLSEEEQEKVKQLRDFLNR